MKIIHIVSLFCCLYVGLSALYESHCTSRDSNGLCLDCLLGFYVSSIGQCKKCPEDCPKCQEEVGGGVVCGSGRRRFLAIITRITQPDNTIDYTRPENPGIFYIKNIKYQTYLTNNPQNGQLQISKTPQEINITSINGENTFTTDSLLCTSNSGHPNQKTCPTWFIQPYGVPSTQKNSDNKSKAAYFLSYYYDRRSYSLNRMNAIMRYYVFGGQDQTITVETTLDRVAEIDGALWVFIAG